MIRKYTCFWGVLKSMLLMIAGLGFMLLNLQTVNAQAKVQDTLTNRLLKEMVDSISTSDKLYVNLYRTSSKSEWSKRLYEFLFRKPQSLSNHEASPPGKTMDEEYQAYADLAIREIRIVVLDPFGTSIETQNKSDIFLDNIGNSLHIATKKKVVMRNLLFKQGGEIRPLDIAASETRLRNTSYINDARIYIDSIPGTMDAIVTVVVRDVWSIDLGISSLSGSKADVRLADKNFYGSGNTLSFNTLYDKNYEQKWAFGVQYLNRNIRGSFVDARVKYLDRIVSQDISFDVDRRLQNNTNYFGQVFHQRYDRKLNNRAWDSLELTRNRINSITFGHAWNAMQTSHSRFVSSIGYRHFKPSFHNIDSIPTNLLYQALETHALIAKFSLFRQRYFREFMIYSFGITESVATGHQASVQIGYINKLHYKAGAYASLSLSKGKRFSFGYLMLEGEVGTNYFDQFENGVLRLKTNYFSPIARVGRLNIRQFVTLSYTKILNVSPNTQYLHFSEQTSFDTDNSRDLARGTERFVINSETDYYTPWNVIGTRFIFFNFADLSFLNSRGALLNSKDLYWGIGLGLRIRNEMFVFKTLELRLGWYPQMDQSGITRFLQSRTSDPEVRADFTPTYPTLIGE